eukprot:g24234.t1
MDEGKPAKEKKKKKKKKEKQQQLLSFGDEEEGEEFQIKKKSSGIAGSSELDAAKMRSRLKKRGRREEQAAAGGGKPRSGSSLKSLNAATNNNLVSSAGVYTPEYLASLRSNAMHLGSSGSAAGGLKKEGKEGAGGESELPADQTAAARAALGGPAEISDGEEEDDALRGAEGGTSSSVLASRRQKQTLIPSESDVEAAKRRRERFRRHGEYIPLDSKKAADGAKRTDLTTGYGQSEENSRSTLMEEDLAEDEEPDIMDNEDASGRLKFGSSAPPSKKTRYVGSLMSSSSSKAASSSMFATDGDENDSDNDDEEVARRLEQQILKSSGAGKILQAASAVKAFQNKVMEGKGPASTSSASGPQAKEPLNVTNKAAVDLAAQERAANAVIEQFSKATLKARKKLDHLSKGLESVSREQDKVQNDVKKLEETMTNLNGRYLFYQQVRDTIIDMLSCLSVKVPLIEEAQDQMKEIMVLRATRRRDQRKQDLQDMAEEAFGESKKDRELEPQLDEFGREIGYAEEGGKAARAEARERRRQRHALRRQQQKDSGASSVDPEGWSSESEQEDEYDTKATVLRDEARTIFADTKPEFSSMDAMQKMLETWKKKFPDEYRDCYIPDSVPVLVAPYVRLELLEWDPRANPSVEHFEWYKKLLDYGIDATGKMVSEDDPDLNLVPLLVSKLVAPVAKTWIQNNWEPTSRQQLVPLQELLKHLQDYDDHAAVTQQLTAAVNERLAQACQQHLQVPCLPSTAAPAGVGLGKSLGSPAQLAFCRTRCWRAVKLFKMICVWRKFLSEEVQELASSHLVDAILPFLSHQVEWLVHLEQSPPSADCQSLEQLRAHVLALARTLSEEIVLEVFKDTMIGEMRAKLADWVRRADSLKTLQDKRRPKADPELMAAVAKEAETLKLIRQLFRE